MWRVDSWHSCWHVDYQLDHLCSGRCPWILRVWGSVVVTLDAIFLISMGWLKYTNLIFGDWNMTFMTFHILGLSSSQLTHIFQRGWNHQPEMVSSELYPKYSPIKLPIQHYTELHNHIRPSYHTISHFYPHVCSCLMALKATCVWFPFFNQDLQGYQLK